MKNSLTLTSDQLLHLDFLVSAPSPQYVHYDIILFHFISLVLLLQFPTERGVFRGFLLLLFLPVCNPLAAHLQRDDSLSLVVDNASIYTVGFNFLVFRK